jgi:acyl dehydratase
MTNISSDIDSGARAKAIQDYYGNAPRVSDWLTVTQAAVNEYCSSVWDSDWMHIDVDRARRESPFGGTVAPGFWTLSVVPYLMRSAAGVNFPEGIAAGINYGFDRIRFLAPVLIGARIRLHYNLVDVSLRDGSRYLIQTEIKVVIADCDKPALVADWKFLLQYRN